MPGTPPRTRRRPRRSSPRHQAASGARPTGGTGASESTSRRLSRSASTAPDRNDLRHAFASLLIHEGRKSIVEIAEQLGHNPTVCLDTYGHVTRELASADRIGA